MPPMSSQGYYRPSNGPTNVQQQSLFQPLHVLPLQHSMPQPSYPASSANMSLQLSFSIGSANLTTTSAQFSVLSPSLGSNTPSTAVPSNMAQTAAICLSVVAFILTNTESTPPPLVTPSQLLQPTLSPLLPSDPTTEGSQVVEASPSSINCKTSSLNFSSKTQSKIMSSIEGTYKFGPYKINNKEVFYSSQLSYAMVNLRPLLPGHILYIESSFGFDNTKVGVHCYVLRCR